MTTPQSSEQVIRPTEPASLEQLRAELFGLLDAIATARAEQAPALCAKFDELWRSIAEPGAEPTLH